MPLATQAETEIIQFLVRRPTAEEIIAFHPSDAVAERFYDLVAAERERPLATDEARDLETFMYIEHMMRLMKAEAHRTLQQKAS
jgi:hypothetical protein